MKSKQNLVIVYIMAAMMQSFFCGAQNLIHQDSPAIKHSEEKIGWQPVELDDKGSNVKNGVEFYSQKTTCGPVAITLAKLVNTNPYAVKVSYQLNSEAPVMNVVVQPSSSLEGYCGASGNESKLLLNPPLGKTVEERKNIDNFIKASVLVNKL